MNGARPANKQQLSMYRVRCAVVALAAQFAFGAVLAAPTGDTDRTLLRISIDTGPNHVRTILVRQFADSLAERLPGRFDVRVYDSGQLYNDRDVVKALLWGDMEMALPTTLYLARFEPAANITSLPMFYGQPPAVIHSVLDGELGQAVAEQVEKHLAVKVLIPNLDLGYVNVFSTDKPLRHADDVAALKVRVPGGIGNIKRLHLQDAFPISIPWSDVPIGLSQGNIDAVATTFETLQSGSLWEVGIRYGFEERGMFLQYVPMLALPFWNKLDETTREEFATVWRDSMDEARIFARERQELARSAAISNEITVVTPSNAEVIAERHRLESRHEEFVRELNIPPHIVAIARRHMADTVPNKVEVINE